MEYSFHRTVNNHHTDIRQNHVMKTALNTPAPTKTVRKTPARRTKPAAVETTETTAPATPTAATPNTTATVTNETPPSDPIPALNTPFGSGVTIVFADLNDKRILSDHAGAFTLAKRCAMAYAVATKTGNTYQSIACGDLISAFKVTYFNQTKNYVIVQVVPDTPTVEFTLADPNFAPADSSRVHLIAPERSAAPQIYYHDLRRVSRQNDCPHCGEFISPHDFSYRDTVDAGMCMIATCSSCSHKVRGY